MARAVGATKDVESAAHKMQRAAFQAADVARRALEHVPLSLLPALEREAGIAGAGMSAAYTEIRQARAEASREIVTSSQALRGHNKVACSLMYGSSSGGGAGRV